MLEQPTFNKTHKDSKAQKKINFFLDGKTFYTLSGNLPPQIAPTNASEVSMKNWHESNTT
jgi:hypothetical protein